VATTDLISRARAGDGEAFRELTEPYRRELQVHCYRMLGSFQDAEDVLQDTLPAAWQGFAGFEGRASLRTWLYQIAINRCLNARRPATPTSHDRRPRTAARLRLTLRGCDGGEIRPRMGVRRPGRTCGPSPRRRLHVDATEPFEYQGRDVVARFCAGIFRADRRFDLIPTRANGQPAFGAYLHSPNGISLGTGRYVLTLTGDRICAMQC
jgi:hypothetical protein